MKEIVVQGKNSKQVIRITCYDCGCVFDTDEFDDKGHTSCPHCESENSIYSSLLKLF